MSTVSYVSIIWHMKNTPVSSSCQWHRLILLWHAFYSFNSCATARCQGLQCNTEQTRYCGILSGKMMVTESLAMNNADEGGCARSVAMKDDTKMFMTAEKLYNAWFRQVLADEHSTDEKNRLLLRCRTRLKVLNSGAPLLIMKAFIARRKTGLLPPSWIQGGLRCIHSEKIHSNCLDNMNCVSNTIQSTLYTSA